MPDPTAVNPGTDGETASHFSRRSPRFSLGQIRVLGFLVPIILLAELEAIRRWLVPHWFGGWADSSSIC